MEKIIAIVLLVAGTAWAAEEFPKPYSPPCVERENVFEFTEKPAVKNLGNDKYEIAFAVKGNCDVTAGIVDSAGVVVRHLGSGVLGANAPAPFQKNSLKQTIYWNGKDDLSEYHKTPEKLKVRVMLGLKPEFDKRLGGTSPKNLPGSAYGIAADETGVFVMTRSPFNRYFIRKFDHDGNYVMTLAPPSANLPESKLAGMGYIEYEPGQRAIHCPGIYDTVSASGDFLPCGGVAVSEVCRPVVVGDRLFYATMPQSDPPCWTINHVYGDGSTSLAGCRTRLICLSDRLVEGALAASPDGRQFYFVASGGRFEARASHAVWRGETDGDKPAALFVGGNAPGSADGKFNKVMDVDCDTQGRVYVCDGFNNRVQVFSPEGKFLKSIAASSPKNVAVHRKTGAVYLLHSARVEGKSVGRLTKYRSFDDPTPVAQVDVSSAVMTLDSWTPKPRVWLGGPSIWEEEGNTFKTICDFREEAKKEDGANQIGWSGGLHTKVVCDPVRDQVYYANSVRFDLKTGALLGSVRLNADDIAFDKRGYVHCHLNPGFDQPGVMRLDPACPGGGSHGVSFPECPYDYGVEGKGGRLGILPCRDQPGAKYFQDGIGVNMMGDVAENCNIYCVPKMDDVERSFFPVGSGNHRESFTPGDGNSYGDFLKKKQEAEKRGEEVFTIRRSPGVPVWGATIWTFNRNGELRRECAAITGDLINGVQIDEDGEISLVYNKTRLLKGKAFLAGRGGVFGSTNSPKDGDLFTGTLMKSAGKDIRVLRPRGTIPMEEMPARPPELADGSWVEGTAWQYAGASPIVRDCPGSCTCPTMRHHTDWYKRAFVPEAYRHSIGVLDTAGNLIMHIGRYGNFDSGDGPKSRIPVGGDRIAITFNRFVSSTDNYLVFDDHGERLVVLKLNYHAEESVGIGEVMSAK